MRDFQDATARRGWLWKAREQSAGEPDGPARRDRVGSGWDVYLIAAAALAPIVVPAGPVNTSILDGLNAVALLVFFATAARDRIPVRFLFAVPMLVILARSLLAVTNAISVPASIASLAKDTYLYLWFTALVALLARRGDSAHVRIAWLVTACAVVIGTLAAAFARGELSLATLFTARGPRQSGTFANANQFADYLMLSAFVVLSLARRVRAVVLAAALALIGIGLITTKSNGGIMSLAAGLAVWFPARAWFGGTPMTRVAGAVALVLAGILLAGWTVSETTAGNALVRRIEERSFLARASHSSESRQDIWRPLGRRYLETPLGLGPGNSSSQPLEIGERERPDSFISKEAHDDYVAYAVERGPLALLAMLTWTAQAFGMVIATRARCVARAAGSALDPAMLASFLAALVGTSVHSMVIEKLNFRHFWLLLGMVCAATVAARAAASHRVSPVPRAVRRRHFLSLARGGAT
jgi:O-antigen ligase/polysaccharide polymerase Wzy-like membrane protein